METKSFFVLLMTAAVIALFGVTEAKARVPAPPGLPSPPGVTVHIDGFLPAPPGVHVYTDGGRPYYVEKGRRVYMKKGHQGKGYKHQQSGHGNPKHGNQGRMGGHGKH